MWENAYLSIKNPKASRALKRALDPGHNLLTSLTQLRFAMLATFGLRTWAPPLTKSWIRTCNSPKFPFLKEEVFEHILAVESLIMMHNDRASSMLDQGFFEIIATLVSDTLLYLK